MYLHNTTCFLATYVMVVGTKLAVLIGRQGNINCHTYIPINNGHYE